MEEANDPLEAHPDGFRTRIRYGKGLRGRFLIRLKDEAEALKRDARLRELAATLAAAGLTAEAPIILKHAAAAPTSKDFEEMVRLAEGRCVATGKVKRAKATFKDLGERWTKGALANDFPDHVNAKKTADLDEGRLEWIYAVPVAPGLSFGALPLEAVSLAHCETVMANLPKRAKRPATRKHYAQLLHRVLELAVYPCKLIAANPLPKGFMPKTGKPPSFPYLYPSDDAALLGCVTTASGARGVPLCYRLLWGFLDREGPRSVSEAAAMRLGHELDLKRGVCSLDRNKTDDARAWAMDPAVVRALTAYAKLRGLKKGDLLFTDENGLALTADDRLAELVRAHLLLAGVDREELHVAGENRRPFRAHDLRGTFVTLSLANGKTETWVKDRTGHTTSTMLERYRRAARSASELGLGPLLPLDQAIPEIAAFIAAQGGEGGPVGGPAEPAEGGQREEIEQKTSHRVDSSVRLEQRIFNPTSTDTGPLGSVETESPCTLESADAHGGPPDSPQVGHGEAGKLPSEPSAVAADPVEQALAEGIRRASAAGAWDAVRALADELRARRESRLGVASLDAQRARREAKG